MGTETPIQGFSLKYGFVFGPHEINRWRSYFGYGQYEVRSIGNGPGVAFIYAMTLWSLLVSLTPFSIALPSPASKPSPFAVDMYIYGLILIFRD